MFFGFWKKRKNVHTVSQAAFTQPSTLNYRKKVSTGKSPTSCILLRNVDIRNYATKQNFCWRLTTFWHINSKQHKKVTFCWNPRKKRKIRISWTSTRVSTETRQLNSCQWFGNRRNQLRWWWWRWIHVGHELSSSELTMPRRLAKWGTGLLTGDDGIWCRLNWLLLLRRLRPSHARTQILIYKKTRQSDDNDKITPRKMPCITQQLVYKHSAVHFQSEKQH